MIFDARCRWLGVSWLHERSTRKPVTNQHVTVQTVNQDPSKQHDSPALFQLGTSVDEVCTAAGHSFFWGMLVFRLEQAPGYELEVVQFQYESS